MKFALLKDAGCVVLRLLTVQPMILTAHSHMSLTMTLYYYGQDITVNEGMLHHFNKLAELHLAGNFRAIRSNAFSKLLHLEKLTLNNVSLTKIED